LKHHQITNINKTIKELTNRLDEVHPYSAFINNDQNRNDGINYWKGKKIISTKTWNDLYEKNSAYIDNYKITLTSGKPLLYFPDDYNGQITALGVVDEKLKEEIANWNADYYELLEFRKNPIVGRMKCSKCLLSGSLDDPIFIGIEKVFARIVTNQLNNNTNTSRDIITYHCNVMNIFSCPFISIESCNKIDEKDETSKYPYKREDLFALHEISFAIEQAITTFSEITKNNEIIYEVDFENDRVQEIHTNYYGEPESWGWQENVNEQLSKVKPISSIVIRDENDIYNILTDREKLETLIEEYEKKNSHRLDNEKQVCCDKKSPYVPTDDDNNSNEKKMMNVDVGNYNNYVYSHRGKNSHSKKIQDKQELEKENIKPDPESKIKEEFEKSVREQIILLKDNKQNIIDFLLNNNKDSIKVEDLKSYEPIYKCYREKGNCHMCNNISNIICISCDNSHHNNKEVWLCTNHWQQHAIENH
jgi:hypothetical protein